MRRIVLTAALAAMVGAGLALPADARIWAVAAEAGAKPATKPAAKDKEIKVRFSTVMIENKEVLRLGETADLHADERAAEVQKRLKMVLTPSPGGKFQPIKASDVTVESVGNAVVVRLRNQNVAQATPQDAALAHMTPEELAQRWATDLRAALSGIKLAQGGALPENMVTVANGEMTMQEAGAKPKGGGAGGGTPKPKKP